jgi:hypothetical protein
MKQFKKLRKRIQSAQTTIEKVDLSKFFKKDVPKRPSYLAAKKREILISFEVRDMFRNMNISSILDEKREASVMHTDTFNLNKVNVVDRVTPCEKTVIVPTAYEIVNDAVLGTFRKGKNFIQHTIQGVEVLPSLDWENFSYPKINPEY